MSVTKWFYHSLCLIFMPNSDGKFTFYFYICMRIVY